MVTNREQQKEVTKKAIITAARELFRTGGHTAATVRAVAKLAGVAVGTVNLHFGGKDQLCFVAHYTEFKEYLAEMAKDIPKGSIMEALDYVLRKEFEYYAQYPAMVGVIRKMFFADGEQGEALHEYLVEYRHLMTEMYGRAIERGEFGRNMDVPRVVLMTESVAMPAVISALNESVENSGTMPTDMILAEFKANMEHYLELLKLRYPPDGE